MGEVVVLRKTPVNQVVVNAATNILRDAKEGMTALMYISVNGSGETEIGLCGEFSDDLEYATEAASEGFSRLVGHKIEQRATKNIIPPRLRRKAIA